MKRLLLLSAVTSLTLFGAAYKLPEQSLKGVALGAANVAACDGADCAYYNSANSAFLEANKQYLEAGLIGVHLPAVKFNGTVAISHTTIIPANGKTKIENKVVPYLHYISKEYGNFRYGLSVTTPGGLVKRWDTPVQKLYAKKFDLKIININPSVTYKVNSNFALSLGADIVYSDGKVQSDGFDLKIPLKRDLDGDSIDYGYNLAATYHLDNGVNLAATYRSKVKLSLEGKANLQMGTFANIYDSSVNVYLPAQLDFAISKDIDKFTLEFVYERTFWSKYKTLDFNYKTALPAALQPSFDRPIPKNWKDTNTFRFGLQYRYNNKITLLAGYSYDQSPIKDKYLSFELPDSDANIFSAGFTYKQNKNLTWGVAALYDNKKSRRVSTYNGIRGKFSKGGAILITAGVQYSF
jgi:long-chain fatty acid transport protein